MVFVCKFCDLDYNIRRDWKRHILKVHGIQSYGCDTCPEAFYEEKDLLEHVSANHDGQLRHRCPHCSMSYKRDKDLDVHIHYKHKIDKMVACEKCGQEFHNNIAYKKHLQMQHKPGHVYHKCKNCMRSFRFKHHLKLHEEFDHEKNGKQLLLKYIKKLKLEKGVLADVSQCRLCKIKFNCSLDLIQHLKLNHAKKKTYACCQCTEAVYYSRASLGIHMRHEHGMLSHSCSKCPAPQRPSRTAPIKPKKVKGKKRVIPASEQRNLFEKSVLRQLTNKPPPKSNTETIEKLKAPWANRFINDNLPSDLELNDVTEQQLNNLRHNIKTVFNILSTVAPSRLKASQTGALSKKPRMIGRNMNIVSFMFPQNHPGSRIPTFLSKKSDNLVEVVIKQVETEQVILGSDADKNKAIDSLQKETNSNCEIDQTLGLLEQNSLLLEPPEHYDAGKNKGIDAIQLKTNGSLEVNQTLGLSKQKSLEPSQQTLTHVAENQRDKLNETFSHSENQLKQTLDSSFTNISEFKIMTKQKSAMNSNETNSSNHDTSAVKNIDNTYDDRPMKRKERNCDGLIASKHLDTKSGLAATSRTTKPCKNAVEGSDVCDDNMKGFKNISDELSKKVKSSKNLDHSIGLNKSKSSNNKPDSVKDTNENILTNKIIEHHKDQILNITDKITEPFINLNDQNNLNVMLEFPSNINVGQSKITKAPEVSISASNTDTLEHPTVSKYKDNSFLCSKKCDRIIAVNKLESPLKKSDLLKDIEASPSKTKVTDRMMLRNQSRSIRSNREEESGQNQQSQEKEKREANLSAPKNLKAIETIESPKKSSSEPNMDILFSLQLTKKKPVDAHIIPKIKVRDFSKDMPAFNAVSPPNDALASISTQDHNIFSEDRRTNISFNECDDSIDTIAQIEAFLANNDTGGIGSYKTSKEDDIPRTLIPSGAAKSTMGNDNQRSSPDTFKKANSVQSTVSSLQCVLEQLITVKPDKTFDSNSTKMSRLRNNDIVKVPSAEDINGIDTTVEKNPTSKQEKDKIKVNTPGIKSSNNSEKRSSKSAHKDKGKEKSPTTKIPSHQNISKNKRASLESSSALGDEIRERKQLKQEILASTKKTSESKKLTKLSQDLIVKNRIDYNMPIKEIQSCTGRKSTSVHDTENNSLKEVHKVERRSKHSRKKSENDYKKTKDDKYKSKKDKKKIKTIILADASMSKNPNLKAVEKLPFLVKSPANLTDNDESLILKSNSETSSKGDKTTHLKSPLNITDSITRNDQVTSLDTLKMSDDRDKKSIKSNQVEIQNNSNPNGSHNKLEDNNHNDVQDIEHSTLKPSDYMLKSDNADKIHAKYSAIKCSSKSNSGDGKKHSKYKVHKKNKLPQLKTKDKSLKQQYDSYNENNMKDLLSHKLSYKSSFTVKCTTEQEITDKNNKSTKYSTKILKDVDRVADSKQRHCEPEKVNSPSLPKRGKNEQDNIITKTSLNSTESNENSSMALSSVILFGDVNEIDKKKKEVQKKGSIATKMLPKKSKTKGSELIKPILQTAQETSTPGQNDDSICNVTTSNLKETQTSKNKETFKSPDNSYGIDKANVASIRSKFELNNMKTISLSKKRKYDRDETNIISKTSVNLTASKGKSSISLSPIDLFGNVEQRNEGGKEVPMPNTKNSTDIKLIPPTVQADSTPAQNDGSITYITTSHSNLKETQISETNCNIDKTNMMNIHNRFETENVKTISLPKKRKHEQEETNNIPKISSNFTVSGEKSSITQISIKLFDVVDEKYEDKEVARPKESFTKKTPKNSRTNNSKHIEPVPPTVQESATIQKNNSICNVITADSNSKKIQISNNTNTGDSPEKNVNIYESNDIHLNKSPSFQDVFIQELLSENDSQEGSRTQKPQIKQGKHICGIQDKSAIVSETNKMSEYSSESERSNYKNAIDKVTSPDNTKAMLLNQTSQEANVDKTSTLSDQKNLLGAPLKRVIILPKSKRVPPADIDYNVTVKGSEIKTNKEVPFTTQKTHLGQDQSSRLHFKKAIVITKDMIIKPNIVGNTSMIREKISYKNINSNGSIKMQVQPNTSDAGASFGHIISHDITKNMITPLDLVNILNGSQQNKDYVKESVKIVNSVPLKWNQTKESFESENLEPEVKHRQMISGNTNFSKHVKLLFQRVDRKDGKSELGNENKINISFSDPNHCPNEINNIRINSTEHKNDFVMHKNDAENSSEHEMTLTSNNFEMPDHLPANKNEFLETESNDSMDVANYVDIVTCSSPNVSLEIPDKHASPDTTHISSAREYTCQFCNLKCDDEIVLLNHLTETHAYGNEKNYETDLNHTLYKCGACGTGFSLKDSLERHAKEEHDEDFKMYVESESGKWQKGTCDTCGEVFMTQMEFDSHGCPAEVELKVEVEHISKKSVRFSDIKNEVKRPKYRKQKMKMYKCDTCNIKFKSGLLLYNHNRKRHTEPIYKCDACNCQFRNKREYLRHRCTPAPIACKKCKITFTSKELLLEHKKKDHNMGSLKCEYCSKYFKTNRNLMKHTTSKHLKTSEYRNLVHKPSKPTKKNILKMNDIYNDLKIINQATADSNSLNEIEKSGDNKAEEGLKKSNKKNKSATNMKHVSIPEHVREICKSPFQSEKELRLHSKIHRSLRRLYKCLKCPKKFSLKSTLLNHIKKDHHLEPNKIHRCQYCCAVFKFEDKLNQHNKFKHSNTGEDTFVTEIKSYSPVIGAQKSNFTAQTGTLINPKEASTTNDKLKTSLILTPKIFNDEMFRCDECNAYLPSKESLHRHIQLEHQKVHNCAHCSQVFTSTESFWQHLINGHGNVKIKELLPQKDIEPAPENTIKWKTQLVHNYKRQGD